ncbi:hypothetical protein [Aegicerativicinus sediminis]|uniref:hypothetical protein n=1 Tax=Aegicerativicinus sediminis TaxID=2893202 RepID=UPI001E2CBCB0|nr:hypothetical protein [Aegicerativicinus sediminis]
MNIKFPAAIIFLLSNIGIAQTINGIIYDEETTINGAKLQNLTTNQLTYTNDLGEFVFSASLNDTLFVTSLFHVSQKIIISEDLIGQPIVIELKKKVNELEQAMILDRRNKKFNSENNTTGMGQQLALDMKNNPHLYNTYANQGVDFLYLAKLFGKLLSKNKYKADEIKIITYQQLDSLLSNDKILNYKNLKEGFDIPEAYFGLFTDYCISKNYNNELLHKENRLVFIDSIYSSAKQFKKTLLQENKN